MVTQTEAKTERVKLTITHAEAAKEYKPGKWVLNFKAKGANDKELRYGCFQKDALFVQLKDGNVIDADVEYKQKETDDGPRTDRTIRQIYIDGKPLVESKGFGVAGKAWGKSAEALAQELLIAREKNTSIEWQVCLQELGQHIRSVPASPELTILYTDILQVRLDRPTKAYAAPAYPAAALAYAEESKPETGHTQALSKPNAKTKAPKTQAKTEETKAPARDLSKLESITDTLRALATDFNIQPKDALTAIRLKSQSEITDTPADFYLKVKLARGL